MGKGIVDELKKEFDINDEWVGFEIHPETPPEGLSLAEKFEGVNMDSMNKTLKGFGSQYGINFGDLKILSNSHMALEASEYARDNGKFDSFHEKLFHSYFSEGKDIGNIDVLIEAAISCGLDTHGMITALRKKTYSERLEKANADATTYEVTGTPTFIINNKYSIVGAQPLESFRKLLKQIESEV